MSSRSTLRMGRGRINVVDGQPASRTTEGRYCHVDAVLPARLRKHPAAERKGQPCAPRPQSFGVGLGSVANASLVACRADALRRGQTRGD
eukprot:2441214-Prymnesium_polylepis.1